MTAVAGRRMAETVARRGGIAVIPQDIPIEVVAEVVAWVKQRHLVHDTAITLGPTDTVGDAIHLLPKRAHGAVDRGRRRTAGRSAWSPRRTASGVDRFAQLRHVMSTELLTVPAEADPRRGFDLLSAGRRRLAPVVDVEGRLVGVLTRQGALRATLYRPALDDEGAAADRRGDRHQRRRRRQGRRAAGGRGGHAGRGHRARPPGADDHARCGRCGDARRRRVPVVGGQRGHRRRRTRPGRRRAPTSSRSASGRARCAPPG